MKLKIEDKVRIIKRDGKGKIIAFYYTYIVVQLENCKECFNVADIVDPAQNELQIKINKEWTRVTKDMLPIGMVQIEHLESSRAFQTSKWKRGKLNG